MRVNFFINVFTIIKNKTNIEILQKENKIYQKTAQKCLVFRLSRYTWKIL